VWAEDLRGDLRSEAARRAIYFLPFFAAFLAGAFFAGAFFAGAFFAAFFAAIATLLGKKLENHYLRLERTIATRIWSVKKPVRFR